MKGGVEMSENFSRTSNVAVVVVDEKTSRTAINNLEAHIRQRVLKGNAREEYAKYNYSFPTEYSGVHYRKVLNEHLKKGTKYDKSSLGEKDFWVGRTYKKNSGKSTTYVETMTICPPFKIHPDEIDAFLQSNDNCYFADIVDFLMMDEKFKDVVFLDRIVHLDEVYVPESITLPDGTEKMLSPEEQWEHAYIKPHMHISYIPTVKVHDDKSGADYLKLSRKDLWHSDKGFSKSYSEFLDRKYHAVDCEYDLERGEIYEEMPEEDKPVHVGLEQWKKENDQARVERLINQQKKENEEAIKTLQQQVEKIKKQEILNERAAESIEEGFQSMIEDSVEVFGDDYEKMDYIILKSERKAFIMLLDMLERIIEPLLCGEKSIFDKIKKIIDDCKSKMEADDKTRAEFMRNTRDVQR